MHRAGLAPVGTAEADGVPHVLVDGAARPRTVLTLSHWPGSPTPAALRADLSVQSALSYLRAPAPFGAGAAVVTCDHLDEDGLVALYAVAFPEAALARADRLVSIARAGDFAVLDDPVAARAAWALRSLLVPGAPDALGGPVAAAGATGGVDPEVLGRLGELVDDPSRFSPLWADEEAVVAAGRAALGAGRATIRERPEVALAVVAVDAGLPPAVSAPVGHAGCLSIHPAVVHAATEAPRVLVVTGRSCTYYDRYETWVAYASRRLPARRDLAGLAVALNEEEREGRWVADPPSALVPVLRHEGGESRLEPARVEALLVAHLAGAPGAWWPHRAVPAGDGPEAVSGSAAPTAGTSGRARPRWRGRPRRWPSA